MKKTRKILEICHREHQYSCIFNSDYADTKPYFLYKFTVSIDENGYAKTHRKLIGKFAHFSSVMIELNNQMFPGLFE